MHSLDNTPPFPWTLEPRSRGPVSGDATAEAAEQPLPAAEADTQVLPEPIDEAAEEQAAAAEAAAIGIRHPKWDERPLLVIVLKKGETATKEDILGFMQGKIAKWWMPDDVAFVNEIPHTATGKILKTKLREAFMAYPRKEKAAFDKMFDGKMKPWEPTDHKAYEPVVELIKFVDQLRKKKSSS